MFAKKYVFTRFARGFSNQNSMREINKDFKLLLFVIGISGIFWYGLAFLPNLTVALIIGGVIIISLLTLKLTLDNLEKEGKTKITIVEWLNLNKFWVLFFAYHILFFIYQGWNANSWLLRITISSLTFILTSLLVMISGMFASKNGTYKFCLEDSFGEVFMSLWKPIWITTIFLLHLNS